MHIRNSALSCVMDYNFWAMGWMVLGSIWNRSTGFFSSPNRLDLCWNSPIFSFPVAKRLGHEDEHSPPCIVENKKCVKLYCYYFLYSFMSCREKICPFTFT